MMTRSLTVNKQRRRAALAGDRYLRRFATGGGNCRKQEDGKESGGAEVLRAIQTEYGGYRFRSRTEARWAIFLDTLGVPYEYEKEAYHFGPGGQYLPDFWLPEQKCFVEIKGTAPTFHERRLCAHLHVRSGYEVFLFQGDFAPPKYDERSGRLSGAHAHFWSGCHNRNFSFRTEEAVGHWERFGGFWKQCPHCLEDGKFFVWLSEAAARAHQHECSKKAAAPPWAPADSPALLAAYAAARTARFEHGETPKRTLSFGAGTGTNSGVAA